MPKIAVRLTDAEGKEHIVHVITTRKGRIYLREDRQTSSDFQTTPRTKEAQLALSEIARETRGLPFIDGRPRSESALREQMPGYAEAFTHPHTRKRQLRQQELQALFPEGELDRIVGMVTGYYPSAARPPGTRVPEEERRPTLESMRGPPPLDTPWRKGPITFESIGGPPKYEIPGYRRRVHF